MISIKVPATSANMGSGFDSIGIAFTLSNEVHMEESDRVDISCATGHEVPKGETNLIYQCAKKVYDICGKPLKGLKIVEHCNIPQTRGLGSSSACTVAGLLGANELLGKPMNQQNIIDLAASIEGHPDNVAPAVLGGFVAALQEYGKVWHVRVPIYGRLDFVVFIPNYELKTEKARAAIPSTIPHGDAVFNLARAALLAGSLVTGDLQNIGVAVGDRLHQPYRFQLIPGGQDIMQAAKGLGALGAYISGAGPSIVAIVDSSDKTYLMRAQMYCKEHHPDWQPILLRCDEQGAVLEHIN
ncbi:MAG: homoserine kinase [Clostridiales bacterium]|nr:homoserine kinase [Clostridiales bacterium]